MTNSRLKNIVLWVAKISTLIISAPATLYLVDLIYPSGKVLLFGVNFLWLIKLAALFLVEGAFLYTWQQLEDLRNIQNKDEREQNTYTAAAWSMYFLLVFVGILHGEGAAAFVLRFTIGLLLYIATSDKLEAMRRKTDKDQQSKKKLTRKVIRAEAASDEKVRLALIQAKEKQQIEAINVLADTIKDLSKQHVAGLLGAGLGEVIDGEVVVEESSTKDTNTVEDDFVVSMPIVVSGDSVEDVQRQAEQIERILRQNTGLDLQNTKEKQQNLQNDVVMRNDCYTVVAVEDGSFVVRCNLCDYSDRKTTKSSKNPKLAATRAGARHCGVHKND